jgi:DNA polymerase-3 subunit epsilon
MPAIAPEQTHFVVLDVETTGLEAEAEILAIGAVRMHGSRILLGQSYEQLVRPGRATWPASIPIHRILPADVSEAPLLAEVLADFARFCAGAILVGHQVALDRAFLSRANHPGAAQLAGQIWFDTQRAGQQLGLASTSLSGLAQHYQIVLPRRHHALTDAFITAQIWQRQLHQCKASGLDTLPALAKLAQIGRIPIIG